MLKLDTYKDWQGNGDELARLAGEILSAEGLPDDRDTLNIRLIRDYTQRGIIGRPERHGKEASYDFRHLIQLVAARVLVADGWPLGKIGEHFSYASEDDLRLLIPSEEKGNKALAAARRLLREKASESTHEQQSMELFPQKSKAKPHRREATTGPTRFRERAAHQTRMQLELRTALQNLGLPAEAPAVEQLTLIAIAPWCQVLVETDRLARITVDEAEEIGRAITASLLSPSVRKGMRK